MDTTILQSIHNILRWAVLLFGVLSLITAMRGIGGRRDFTAGDKRTALYFLIACDAQLLMGLILYFLKGYQHAFSSGAMSTIMKEPVSRFWTIEHPVGMLLAIILVHVGYAGAKGLRPHKAKFTRLFWCSLIALVIFAVTIPWPFRAAGIARPWLPGM